MLKVVKFVDNYEPIEVIDQYDKKYLCINVYEAAHLMDCLRRLEHYESVLHGFDTGDWYKDLPIRISKWLSVTPTNSKVEEPVK